jgi:hypothetical protein
MLSKKMDATTTKQIRSILDKLNIKHHRILIDLEKETIELNEEEDYSVDDLLESAGVLTQERVRELRDEINKMREEWN